MVKRKQLVDFLNQLLLENCACADKSNNGLQVEGGTEVNSVIVGVDACSELFEAVIEENADFVVVHHGMSWGDNLRYLTRTAAKRLRLLMKNDISLYAAHLPLDAHPEVGNNAVIAEKLNLKNKESFSEYGGVKIGYYGDMPSPVTIGDVQHLVEKQLQGETAALSFGPQYIKKVGIVSGGGADAIEDCPELGIDCLVTGEFGHSHYHLAKEVGVHVVAAGHYQTEVWGVKAVMERIEQEYDMTCRFIDIPTGY